MSYHGKVPFSKDGSLLGYVDAWTEKSGIEWRDNVPFRPLSTWRDITADAARPASAGSTSLVDRSPCS